jgi:hypothetical protein
MRHALRNIPILTVAALVWISAPALAEPAGVGSSSSQEKLAALKTDLPAAVGAERSGRQPPVSRNNPGGPDASKLRSLSFGGAAIENRYKFVVETQVTPSRP